MAGKRIQKQLYYKHARFLLPTKDRLQDLFDKAIRALPIPERNEVASAVDPTAGAVKLINSPRVYSGCNFGVMVLYSPGINHQVIDLALQKGKDELDVSALPAPVGKQFMETPLFFVIRDNHVVFLRSKALDGRDLESHLNWLLQLAGVIEEEQRIELSDAIPAQTAKLIQAKPIRAIQIGLPLVDSFEQAPTGIGGKISAAVSTVAKGLGIDALKGFLSATEYAGLKLEEMTESPNIQVNIEIKVVGTRAKPKTSQDQASVANEDAVMARLMRELRHVEDASFIKVETRGGGHLDGNDLRVQAMKSVASYDGVLDTSDTFEVMRKWLETLVGNGAIDPGA